MNNPLRVIIGIGKTGLSCVRFGLKNNWQMEVIDSENHPKHQADFFKIAPRIKYCFGKIDRDILARADEIILSPGVDKKIPEIAEAINNGKKVLNDIEIFLQLNKKPVIAITGTNGKTTVTELVGLMAKESGINVQVAGNIGTPILDVIDDSNELYVLELSSFQLESINNLGAQGAIILNITEDHSDRYKNFAEYAKAKHAIYNVAKNIIVNNNDATTYFIPKGEPIFKDNNIKFVTYCADKITHYYHVVKDKNRKFLARDGINLIDIADLPRQNEIDLENSLAAIALGDTFAFKMPAMLDTIRKFIGLKHRCQVVRIINGVTWVNDSKATNVGAAICAIKSFRKQTDGKIILIAGGSNKDLDFTPLKKSVSNFVSKVILIGQTAELLEKVLCGASDIVRAHDLEAAVLLADKVAEKHDIVLLSPACASFDMFNDYKHRGDEFIRCVNLL